MASTTTGLSNLMSIYYDKVFLERAEEDQMYSWGATMKKVAPNSGKTVYFNRFSPLAKATTALTEATNPTAVDMTSTIVSATVAEYGNYTTVGSLFDLTSIDEGLKEHVEVHGQNAGETLDELTAAELSANATAQLASGKSLLTAIATSDTLDGAEVRKAVRTLKQNKCHYFDGGMLRGIVSVSGAYDLRGDSEWLDAYRYTEAGNIRNGVLGKLHGVEFAETNNEVTESSTTTVYHNYIFGKHAYGQVDISSTSTPKIYVKRPSANSTDNPLDLFSTIGWKATFVAKVLNANWLINIKTGFSG